MASRRRISSTYRTYGSVAYAPAYDGSAVRVPRREEEQRRRPQPIPRQRPRERTLTRTQVQVREAGAVAPFAVLGFLAVGVFAALLLLSYTRFTVLNDEVISLQGELSQLQSENITLAAEYERVFDMERIQEAVGESMVRPSGDQVVYIDLSQPDTVTLYTEEGEGLGDLLHGISQAIAGVIEYFQ